jgi:hypothetical protein
MFSLLTTTAKDTGMDVRRYAAAAWQTVLPNSRAQRDIGKKTIPVMAMIEAVLAGRTTWLPGRLIVLPAFAHAVPMLPTVEPELDTLAIPFHTRRQSGWPCRHASTMPA